MKPFNLFPYDSNLNFMRLRYISLGIATLIMVIAIGAMALKSFNFALDFTGGTVTELHFAKPANVDTVAVLAVSAADGASGCAGGRCRHDTNPRRLWSRPPSDRRSGPLPTHS